jgi:hypothetical protein
MDAPPIAVSLRCANCGAALQVPGDVDALACGFCGTEHLVRREGGFVALKRVVDAIRHVQTGTDKTAAELALVRLQNEAGDLERERALALEQATERSAEAVAARRARGGKRAWLAVLGGVVGGFLAARIVDWMPLWLVGVVLGLGAAVWLGIADRRDAGQRERSGQAELAGIAEGFERRRGELRDKVLKARRIVDS